MELNQIRTSFLDFFKGLNHRIVPSSSLIPHNDPSLLFTNAGMVQFKNYFTGIEVPAFTRAATSQKCIRAGGKHNDLENVGYTARHHTFFEMLGNFSFLGDYFKEFAIESAWQYLTEVLSIDRNRLYITVYNEDDKAYNIWQKLTGFSSSKIIKIATNDNFWSMGDVGPCGPCSEIFFDHGDKYQGGLPGTPDEGGDRYIEIWNLVFMQYEQLSDGKRIALPKPAIDTGIGIERVTAVMQGVNDNYDTDLFLNLRRASRELSKNEGQIASHKVIADHLRSSCFLIADGVMPSNEGRGYVLRRIMRRAMRHIHMLGGKDLMLHKLVPILVSEMSEAYPELKRAESVIKSVLESEEERFGETLDRGLKILASASEHLKAGEQLSGEVAFNLYDTYGFPLDLTKDILRGRNISVNEAGFEEAMEDQKKRAKAAWAGSGEQAEEKIWHQIYYDYGATQFLGYETHEAKAKVLAIIVGNTKVEEVEQGEAIVVTDKTPFYAESGGQVGDVGLAGKNTVLDVKKYSQGIFGHHIEIVSKIRVGEEIFLSVDNNNRNKIRANHSATHLLHKVLRDILGGHITQKGSIVNAEKLRFDFSHNRQLSSEELILVEEKVNQMIVENRLAIVDLSTPKDAIEKGAMALFGEKYGDEVRVVSLGSSVELCSGTHVRRTGDIGYFKIVSEESVAAGIRRIEAMTGMAAVAFSNTKQQVLKSLTASLKCAEVEIINKVHSLQAEIKSFSKDLSHYKGEYLASDVVIKNGNSYNFVYKIFSHIDNDSLKTVLDIVKKKNPHSLICLVNELNNQATIIISVSGNALEKLKSNDIAKFFTERAGGRGGGNINLAQLGGCNLHKIKEALKELEEISHVK
ncbi:MAG: alanine--tRNA ligase [Candidatus Midichloria sp.]|uniref:Alanine--tRNA ligase n=1 Tax=Hyalomma marginatum TaxID=34627 RepID=A0A8S4C2T4_9ACAR|nr:alanine--tRNA ligase [Hyalomma marginatum]CAG7599889.1 alanine--tRNA ligase [Hyalomma marginatum]